MYNPSPNPADHPFPATLPAPVDHWLRTRTTNVPAQLIVNWALASLIIAVSNPDAEHLNARASALRYLIEIQSTHFKARILAAQANQLEDDGFIGPDPWDALPDPNAPAPSDPNSQPPTNPTNPPSPTPAPPHPTDPTADQLRAVVNSIITANATTATNVTTAADATNATTAADVTNATNVTTATDAAAITSATNARAATTTATATATATAHSPAAPAAPAASPDPTAPTPSTATITPTRLPALPRALNYSSPSASAVLNIAGTQKHAASSPTPFNVQSSLCTSVPPPLTLCHSSHSSSPSLPLDPRTLEPSDPSTSSSPALFAQHAHAMQRIARASHHAFTGRTTWSAPLIEDQPFTFRADECAHLSRNLKQSDRAMKTLIQARTSGIELLFVAPFTAGYHRNNPTPADVQRNRLIDDFSMYVQRFCDLSGHNVSILNTAVMLDAVMAHVHNRITTLQSDHRASASNAPTTNPDPAKPPPAPTPPGP